MGRILRVAHRRLGRQAAVKELLVNGDPELAARFEREVKITARLQHPSIVPVHEAGRWPDGRPFYEMKLVSGLPFHDVMKAAGTLDERLALLPRLLAVVEALAYAHGQRVIHRDLKPGNVLVGKFGETVVVDWGLAKDLSSTAPEHAPSPGDRRASRADETRVGDVLGTPAYMPPEQADGRAVDERADVYALGAMLYFLLAGRPPYHGATVSAVLEAVRAGPPIGITTRAPGAPPELAAIVERAMARDPAARYPTAEEMAEDLRRFQTGQLVGSHRYTRWQLLRRFMSRHRMALTAGATALAATLTVGGLALTRIVAQSRAERAALLESLQGQSVQALVDGEPMKAAAAIVPVYRERPNDPVVRFLVARALATIDPLERSLTGHPRRVNSATFDREGARVVTASADGTAKVWDARTGALLSTIAAGDKRMLWAELSPQGDRIVTGQESGTVSVWDARTGARLVTLEGHAGVVKEASFSPDGSRIVTAGWDGTARIWDAHDGAAAGVLHVPGSRKRVMSATFSPDGTKILTASADGAAQIWDARTLSLVRSIDLQTRDLWSAAFDPVGARIITAVDESVAQIWSATTGSLLATLVGHRGGVMSAAFCGDGTRVVTSSADHTARVWDARTGGPLAVLDGHAGPVRTIACTPDGTRLATASDDTTAKLWAMPATARLPVLGTPPAPVNDAVFSPDGARVATAGRNGIVEIWDVRTGARLAQLMGHSDEVNSVRFSPDGARVVTASADKTVCVWDGRKDKGTPLVTLSGPAPLSAAVFSPRSADVASSDFDGAVRLWNIARGEQATQVQSGSPALIRVAYSPDGGRLAAAAADGWVRVLDGRTGEVEKTLGVRGTAWDSEWSPDGESIAASYSDGTVRILDARSGETRQTLVGHAADVMTASFSPDGRFIVTSSYDGTMRVWNAANGAVLDALSSSRASLHAAAFSPDGQLAVTASDDGTAHLWDLHLETRSPEEVARIVAERALYRLEGGRLVAVPPPVLSTTPASSAQ
jgi:WD40 repeat protein